MENQLELINSHAQKKTPLYSKMPGDGSKS
jgi:hypothetical protein